LALLVLQCLAQNKESMFSDFMSKYGKTYEGSEYIKRFAIFVENLKIAEELNKRSPLARFGVTKFSDLTKTEFRSNYLLRNFNSQNHLQKASRWEAPENLGDLPPEYDWNNASTKCLTPVYNQEQCGSCWAFSTTESIESMWALAGNQLTSLSMQ